MEKENLQVILSAQVYEPGSCACSVPAKLKLTGRSDAVELHIEGKAYVIDDDQLAAAINFLQAVRVTRDMESSSLRKRVQKLEHELAISQRRNLSAEQKAEKLFY